MATVGMDRRATYERLRFLMMQTTQFNYQVVSHSSTDKGNVREHNEDHLLASPNEGLWVVADGAGGHDRGEVASQLIVEGLQRIKKQLFVGEMVREVEQKLQQVNQQLIAMRSHEGSSGILGSTVCVLLLHQHHLVCLWAGDSRIYLLRKGELRQLTDDHNRMDEFRRAGFSEEELAKYPMARQLVRAVGVNHPLLLEYHMEQWCDEDVLLLCSDGLSGELEEKMILDILSAHTEPKSAVNQLVQQVLLGRARDNISAIVVRIKELH